MKLLPYLIFFIISQSWFAQGGKMYTPIHLWHKVACLPEEIKVSFAEIGRLNLPLSYNGLRKRINKAPFM